MVDLHGVETIKGCRKSIRFQKLYQKYNDLYFDGRLPKAKVFTAPLLNVTKLTQKEAQDKENWVDAGCYGIVGIDEDDEVNIIIDRGTCVFHTILAKTTLLHEQIHLYIGLDKGHGRDFKTQIRRIASLGALDNLI